jgi:hypothetical protein
MKERRERVMGDFVADAATETNPLDYVIAERFRMERHPQRSVDGEYPYGELPGMWDESDLSDTEGA